MNEPCECGAEDCIRCHPECFEDGRYVDVEPEEDQEEEAKDETTTGA